MPFAPTRNNRVAPRKRTLTSPIPTVKNGTGTVRPPRPQMRINAEPIKVVKQPFIGVKARPLKTKITKKKSR